MNAKKYLILNFYRITFSSAIKAAFLVQPEQLNYKQRIRNDVTSVSPLCFNIHLENKSFETFITISYNTIKLLLYHWEKSILT